MPTLDFKGKPFVYSHHLSVPFRELVIDAEKSLSVEVGPSLDDNLIIHGDNLEALKALLPRYAGKVDVIYIDPPEPALRQRPLWLRLRASPGPVDEAVGPEGGRVEARNRHRSGEPDDAFPRSDLG
jgi:hypothetical protein